MTKPLPPGADPKLGEKVGKAIYDMAIALGIYPGYMERGEKIEDLLAAAKERAKAERAARRGR